MAKYLSSSAIYDELDFLARNYSNICTVGSFVNATSQGVTGKYIRIAATAVVDGASVLITGGVHGREWAPPDALLSLAEKLLDAYTNQTGIDEGGYSLDAKSVQRIVNGIEIYIAPVVNPDGRDFSMAPAGNKKWRKNLRTIQMMNPATGKNWVDPQGNPPIGVDNNRNHDIEWDYEAYFLPTAGVESSKDPNSDQFIGTGAASEAETQNVVQLLTGKKITHYFDVHANDQSVLYSWGIETNQSTDPCQSFTNQLPKPQGWLKSRDGTNATAYSEFIPASQLQNVQLLADNMVAAAEDATGTVYRSEQSAKLYVTTGAGDDFAYSRDIETMYAFTFELGGANFWPDRQKDFPGIEKECHAGLLAALDEISRNFRPSQNGAAGPGGPGSAGTTSPPCGGAGGGGIPPAPGGGGGGTGGGGAGGGGPKPAGQPQPIGRGGAPSAEHEHCRCKVKSIGHCSRFHVEDRDGFREQVLFIASPVLKDRVLAYETITNNGPQAVRVQWDGGPSALLLPGNSMTIAAGQSVKIVYEASSALTGDYAEGTDVISWCCPRKPTRN